MFAPTSSGRFECDGFSSDRHRIPAGEMSEISEMSYLPGIYARFAAAK